MNTYSYKKILFIIFVVLLVVVFAPGLMGVAREKIGFLSRKDNGSSEVMTKIDPKDIQSISIERAGSTISLDLKDGVWYVNGYKAAQNRVMNLINGISKMNTIELASTNPDNQESLAVTETDGFLIKINNDDNRAIIVGKRGLTPGSYYVRKSGSNDTYLMELDISSLTTTLDAWRDKVVINISDRDLSEVKLSGDTKGSYSEGADSWDAIKQGFSPLTAYGFLTDDQISEFDNAVNKTAVSLKFRDGSEDSMQVYKTEEEYWLEYNKNYYKLSFQDLTFLFPEQ